MNPSLLSVPGALLVAALAFLPFGRLVELPLACLSLMGLWAIWEGPSWRRGVPWLPLLFIYGAFTIPMITALPDAVASGKSLRSTVGTLRFLLPVVALLWFYELSWGDGPTQRKTLHRLGLGAAVLLLLWNLDGLLQFVTGENILGYGTQEGERYINGVFGENDNVKFGLTVALLMPLGLVHALRHWSQPASLAFLLLCLALIALSGKRAAWIVSASELAALALYYRWRGSLDLRRLLVPVLAAVVAMALVYGNSEWVQTRSQILVVALDEPDYDNLNAATGKRLPIWSTALAMGRDNWINGVGPRGFRFAYADYAAPGDFWAQPLPDGRGSRGVHAHQLLLDLQAETGMIGVAGYFLLVVALARLWLRAGADARSRALPYGVSMVGMLFPLNTHPAWYSSWSGQLLWLFIALYLYALCEPLGSGDSP